MKNYKNRVFDSILRDALDAKGAVLIEGAKWCGLSFFFVEPHGLPLFFADPLDITIWAAVKTANRP